MKLSRLLTGITLGALLVGATWWGGWVLPPESLARRLAVVAAVYPGPVGEAQVERIECPPLRRLRFYVVCTQDCDGVWRLIMVKGLQPALLINPGRTPPEPISITRHRINAAIGREALRLDADGAREMVACFLRFEGLHPELVLTEAELPLVSEARDEGEDAMRRLAESLDDPLAARRIAVEATSEGYLSDLFYWDTWRIGAPVLRMRIGLAPGGQLRLFQVTQPAEPGATEPGATEGP
jgi:hypothetical protein